MSNFATEIIFGKMYKHKHSTKKMTHVVKNQE